MPKFYVVSKNMRCIVTEESPRMAAIKALNEYYDENMEISSKIVVSERGFEYNYHEDYEDHFFDTKELFGLI